MKDRVLRGLSIGVSAEGRQLVLASEGGRFGTRGKGQEQVGIVTGYPLLSVGLFHELRRAKMLFSAKTPRLCSLYSRMFVLLGGHVPGGVRQYIASYTCKTSSVNVANTNQSALHCHLEFS